MREFVGRILRTYSRILNKHKYATQIATGGLLWFSGDILCQGLVHLVSRSPNVDSTGTSPLGSPLTAATSRRAEPFAIDWRRAGKMTMYGICFSAPAYAFWYSFLERHSQRVFAAQPPGTSLAVPTWLRSLSDRVAWRPLQNFLVAGDSAARLRTWKIIGYKLGMDTFVFDPLYLSLFFTATGLMEGRAVDEVGRKLRQSLAPTWLVDIAVWTPIQAANFRWVPVLYQALVVQSCNIGWNAYLSFVQHRSRTDLEAGP